MPTGAFANVLLAAGLACAANLLGVLFVRARAHWAERHALKLAAFAAGVMVGAAFLHLIPESAALVVGGYRYSLAAFLFLFLIENHLVPHRHAHENDLAQQTTEPQLPPMLGLRRRPGDPSNLGLMVALGFALHSIFDGLAIGSGFTHDFRLGIISTAAVLAHELPEGMATFSVLIYARYSSRRATFYGVAVALMAPLVAISSFLFFRGRVSEGVLGITIALVAGSFLYIGGSDLLPEASRDRKWTQTLLVFAGALLMFAVTLIE